jgi:predicted nucleotidyltransferase
MAKAYEYPAVTEDLLDDVVGRIVAAGHPDRILLFGSRARGDAAADSDLDLLVIEETDVPRRRRAARYREALRGLFPSKDIVVWTAAEADEWSNVPQAFVTTALREGRLLYERGEG